MSDPKKNTAGRDEWNDLHYWRHQWKAGLYGDAGARLLTAAEALEALGGGYATHAGELMLLRSRVCAGERGLRETMDQCNRNEFPKP